MKKSIFLSLLFALILGTTITFSSCNGCSKAAPDTEATEQVDSLDSIANDSVAEAVFSVENVLSTDKEYMFMNYGGDYRWFETCIVLQDFLDEECDGTVTGISNVFQVVEEKDKGADTFVVLAAHTPDTTAYEVKHGFWVEDFPMNDDSIKVTFAQAFEKINQVNLPKPHSRQVVLRKQVGPVAANPQYIFGNVRAQIYVDAVTGDVTDKNPCFPEEDGFKMPLGEWP